MEFSGVFFCFFFFFPFACVRGALQEVIYNNRVAYFWYEMHIKEDIIETIEIEKMAVQNPNNWHWVDKNCINWAKEYFTKRLLSVPKTQQGSKIQLTKLSSFSGDCEVNQRKGKIISLYDLQMTLLYEGVDAQSGEKYEGSITIPEVAFDTENDDYQFDIAVYKETSKVGDQFRKEIRQELIPEMTKIFIAFQHDLLAANANDIQVPEDQVKSEYTKQNTKISYSKVSTESSPVPASIPAATSKPTVKPAASTKKIQDITTYNTSSLHLEPTFNCRSVDLYDTFIDKQRINVWGRGSLQVVSSTNMQSGKLLESDFIRMFGGNIECKVEKLVSKSLNEEIVLKWRLKDWLSDYYSVIHLKFKQSDEYNETKIQIIWDNIPVGQEDLCKNNFEEYYIKSIKISFGFGAIL